MLSYFGQCNGTVASRCTRPEEGPRRKSVVNCADVGLTCGVDAGNQVACVDPKAPPKSADPKIAAQATTLRTRIFRRTHR